MAEPQKQNQNYLTEVNRDRQQARSSRRRRLDDTINPLDSAAAMDRLQGVDVGDFSSGGVDSPPIMLASMPGGGGGTAAVTTVGYNTRQQSPQYFPAPRNPCANGKCLPQSGVVTSSMPTSTTVVTRAAPSMMTSAPMTTVASTPSAPRGTAQYYESRADGALGSFAAEGRSNPIAGKAYQLESVINETRRQEQTLLERQREVERDLAPAREAAIAAVKADTQEKLANASLNTATAQKVREATASYSAETEAQMLEDIILQGKSPETFVNAMTKLDSNMGALDEQGKAQANMMAASPQQVAKRRRQAFGAFGAHIMLSSAAFDEHAREKSAQQVGIVVGRDPTTGAPVESVQPKGDNPDKRATIQRSLDAIAAGYKDAGLIGGDWRNLNAALVSDVYSPMREFSRQRYATIYAKEIEAGGDEARAQVLGRADRHADAWFDAIRTSMSEQNGKAGGGTIGNPEAGWWRQVSDSLSPSAPVPHTYNRPE
jgi:hypothetical protein